MTLLQRIIEFVAPKTYYQIKSGGYCEGHKAGYNYASTDAEYMRVMEMLQHAHSKPANSSEKTPHPGFLVWNPRGGPPRYTHDTLDSAQTEAKRLAVKVHSTPFYVLAPVGAAFADVTVLPVTFNAVPHIERPAFDLDSEIPF